MKWVFKVMFNMFKNYLILKSNYLSIGLVQFIF